MQIFYLAITVNYHFHRRVCILLAIPVHACFLYIYKGGFNNNHFIIIIWYCHECIYMHVINRKHTRNIMLFWLLTCIHWYPLVSPGECMWVHLHAPVHPSNACVVLLFSTYSLSHFIILTASDVNMSCIYHYIILCRLSISCKTTL